jgi:hypothetical protein
MTPARPYLSVIVPVHNGERVLRESLPALLASTLPRALWELIIIDDASADASATVAAEYADVVVCLPDRPRGPAYARNRGVESSRGVVVVFIDADVCVHADTLSRIAAAFVQDGGLTALFGSYDAEPTAPGLVSQFRNLLHHHVHQSSPGAAETFWAGCGAVRRDALLAAGLMDAWHFPRPQIEDIELGRRLRRAGHRIELRPDIQCSHLKRWTLRNMIVTDFRDRGTPWMWLILSEGAGSTPATLNLKVREKVCTALVALAALAAALAVLLTSWLPLLPAAGAVALIVALNLPFYRLLRRARGVGFAIACVPLHLIFYFTGGLAAIAGTALHYWRRVPAVQHGADAERTPSAWPPRPDRPPASIWALAAERARR